MERGKKVIVAVHGIGDQTAFETVQAIVRQFCKFYGQPATVSLGRLDSDIRSSRGSLALLPPLDPQLPLNIGFTEVYWAEIAREVETKGYRLEDTRHWARTIIERLRLHHEKGVLFTPQDYALIKVVLEETINAITVSELLMTLFKNVGSYRPKLEQVLTNYLGDVQLVAEFRGVRELILAQFDKAMQAVYANDPDAGIYIIAHSEGTVVSFLGLLRALQDKADSGSAPLHPWLDNVKGFITLGSPIDKHLVLWPELWQEFDFRGKETGVTPVPWQNYYDFGDPVGFRLDTARSWLDNIGCNCFDFPESRDFGFTRSYFPGKAHVDYWNDTELFGHMIKTVIAPHGDQPKPASKYPAMISSRILPFVAAFLPLLAGVYLLYCSLDDTAAFGESGGIIGRNSFFIALLLAGVTVLSRVVRLTKSHWLRFLATLFYLATTGLFTLCVEEGARVKIGKVLTALLCIGNDYAALVIASMVIAICGLFSRRYSLLPLLLPGFIAVAWILAWILFQCDEVYAVGSLFVTTIGFFCLWWLSATIFDLSFIWHAYIRNNRAMDRLHELFLARSGR